MCTVVLSLKKTFDQDPWSETFLVWWVSKIDKRLNLNKVRTIRSYCCLGVVRSDSLKCLMWFLFGRFLQMIMCVWNTIIALILTQATQMMLHFHRNPCFCCNTHQQPQRKATRRFCNRFVFFYSVANLINDLAKESGGARHRLLLCTECNLMYDWFGGFHNKFNSY